MVQNLVQKTVWKMVQKTVFQLLSFWTNLSIFEQCAAYSCTTAATEEPAFNSPKNNARSKKMYPNFGSQKGAMSIIEFLNKLIHFWTVCGVLLHQPPQKSKLSQFSFFTVKVVFILGLHRLTFVVFLKKNVKKSQKVQNHGPKKSKIKFQKVVQNLIKKQSKEQCKKKLPKKCILILDLKRGQRA